MKLQLFLLVAVTFFISGYAQNPSEACVAASLALNQAAGMCFGGNIGTFTTLMVQLPNDIIQVASDPTFAFNIAQYETVLNQFCQQTCVDIFYQYLQTCLIVNFNTSQIMLQVRISAHAY